MEVSKGWCVILESLPTLYTILLFDVRGTVKSLLVAVVPDRNVCSGLSEGLSDSQTDASTGTRYDDRLALVREER